MNNVIKKGHIMDTLRASCMKVVECKKSIISGNEELTLEMGGVKVICKTEGQ